MMISNAIERLFIVYSNKFLQKNVFFLHVRNFTSIYGPFRCLIDVLSSPIFMENICNFYKFSLTIRAHALQSELNKVGYTNFVKFRLQSMSSENEQAFRK